MLLGKKRRQEKMTYMEASSVLWMRNIASSENIAFSSSEASIGKTLSLSERGAR
jgi:hypothetical protein